MKLLLILPGAIGDFILSLPSVAWLRWKLKPSRLEIWAERVNLPLAISPGYADRALALADTGLDRWPTPEAVIARLKEFDRVISWHGASYPEWNEEMRRQLPQLDFLPGFPRAAELHAMDFRQHQVESLVGAGGSFPPYPQIEIPQQVTGSAAESLAAEIGRGMPVVMIHPGASSRRKQWDTERFSQLVTLLMERSNQVLLCEGPLDHDTLSTVTKRVSADKTTVPLRRVRIDDLMQLAGVIQRCGLYIGNDSGIGHLAAATGIPTLSIFTVTDPRIWAPRGPRVKVLVRPSVKEVLEEASRIGL